MDESAGSVQETVSDEGEGHRTKAGAWSDSQANDWSTAQVKD
jgi:hypothetical protein